MHQFIRIHQFIRQFVSILRGGNEARLRAPVNDESEEFDVLDNEELRVISSSAEIFVMSTYAELGC